MKSIVKKYCLIVIICFASTSSLYANLSYQTTQNTEVSRLTNPVEFGTYSANLQLSQPVLATFSPSDSMTNSNSYIDIHTMLSQNPPTDLLVLDTFTAESSGQATTIKQTNILGPGIQPSILNLGGGNYLEVNSTQGAHAIEAHLLKVTQNSVVTLASESLGNGKNPSIATIGNGYYLVISSNKNIINRRDHYYLGAYVFKVSTHVGAEKIFPPTIMKTCGEGVMPSIIAIAPGKFLETNNISPTTNGVEYKIISASSSSITATPITLSNPNEDPIQYESVHLSKLNNAAQEGTVNKVLIVFTNKNATGLWTSTLSLSNDDQALSASQPVKYGESGSDPDVFAIADNKYLEMDANKINGQGNQTLFTSILH